MVATATPPAEGKKPTPTQGYEILCRQAQKAGPDAQKRIAAHLRAVMGRSTLLPVYHNDPNISGEDKLKLYSLCVRAIMSKDFSILQGQDLLGAGAAGEQPKPAAPTPAQPEAETQAEPEPEPPAPAPRPEPTLTVEPPVPPTAIPVARANVPGDGMSPIARAIFEEIAPFLPKPEEKLDTDAVKQLAEEVFKHQINNGGFPEDRVKKLVEENTGVDEDTINELIKSALEQHGGTPKLIVLNQPSGTTVTFSGDVHWQFEQIATWIAAGPVWAWGDGGGGKTHLMYQIAKATGLTPYIVSVDPTMTVGKLQGYRNLSTGEFVEGLLYKPFKEGGLLGLDEVDTGDPGILACLNALISNDYFMFPNGEVVQKHANFRIIAGANTKGMGATAGYTARQKLDAATLDRFAIIKLEYDEALETAIALGRAKEGGKVWKKAETNAEERETQCARWVTWVQSARKTVDGAVLISPRASIMGCKAIRLGIPVTEVADSLVFKLCSSDTRHNILRSCGTPH